MSETENARGAQANEYERRRRESESEEAEAQAESREETDAAGYVELEVQNLRKELETAYRRVDELARAVQAGERDREDFKKRLTRERERMIDVEKGNVAQILLETVDDLDLSLQSAGDSPLTQGVKMIRTGILSRLASLGVERLELAGKPFDPNVAEAIDMEITPSPDDDQIVVQELRPAYQLKGRLIRPGRVKVAKYVEPANA